MLGTCGFQIYEKCSDEGFLVIGKVVESYSNMFGELAERLLYILY